MGSTPERVSASRRSKARARSASCSSLYSVLVDGLASSAACDCFVHDSPTLMIVGRRALSVSSWSERERGRKEEEEEEEEDAAGEERCGERQEWTEGGRARCHGTRKGGQVCERERS